MKLASLAARRQLADERLQAAAGQLAGRHGVDGPAPVGKVRDPQVRAVMEREAVADFLERLTEADEPKAEAATKPTSKRKA